MEVNEKEETKEDVSMKWFYYMVLGLMSFFAYVVLYSNEENVILGFVYFAIGPLLLCAFLTLATMDLVESTRKRG